MAIKKIQMIPEGTNDYGDVLHPETTASQVIEETNKKFMTGVEKTNVAKIPNIEEDLETHKAESATENVHGAGLVNGLATLDIDGDVPLTQLGKVPEIPNTIWKKIDEITLGVNTSKLDITVPIGYSELRIKGTNIQAVETTTTDDGVIFRFNNDSVSNQHRYMYLKDGAIGVGSNPVGIQIKGVPYHHNSSASFDARIVLGDIDNYTYVHAVGIGSNQDLTVGNWITKAVVHTISMLIHYNKTFKAGSTFEIWGRK